MPMIISNLLKVIISSLCLLLRNMTGNKIHFHYISLISPFATIKTTKEGRVKIGRKCAARANSEITANGGTIEIGENCFVNRNCMIVAHESILFGDNVTIGPGSYIFDHDHGKNGTYISQRIVLEDNVWVGAGSIILKGVTIGHDSIIAAGSVITKNVPPNTTVVQKCKSENKVRSDG